MGTDVTALLPVPADPPPHDGVLRYLGIEGCVRLPIRVNHVQLAAELDHLPADAWGQASRDPVVQASVESFFAVGYPRGPRPVPPDDRASLSHLPHLRHFIREVIAASPTRAIVARLAPRGLIPIHTDTPRFFRGTLRLSVQVVAEGTQRLYCNGLWYDMALGEVWAVDNLRPHGIHNSGTHPRINVLVDYLPSNQLATLVSEGEQNLGIRDEAAQHALQSMTRERYRTHRWRALRYEIFKLLWRRG